jgi:hypothetical protein
MKIKEGFELKEVCGEHVIFAYGKENIDFSKIISLNETAAFLWNTALDRDFDAALLVKALCNEYEVDEETAREDVKQIIATWTEIGLIKD